MHDQTSHVRENALSVGLTLFVLGASAVLLVLYAWTALGWYDRPFLGFLLSRDLMLADDHTLTDESNWPAFDAGMDAGDRVVALDGVRLDTLDSWARLERFDAILEGHAVGDEVEMRFWRQAS